MKKLIFVLLVFYGCSSSQINNLSFINSFQNDLYESQLRVNDKNKQEFIYQKKELTLGNVNFVSFDVLKIYNTFRIKAFQKSSDFFKDFSEKSFNIYCVEYMDEVNLYGHFWYGKNKSMAYMRDLFSNKIEFVENTKEFDIFYFDEIKDDLRDNDLIDSNPVYKQEVRVMDRGKFITSIIKVKNSKIESIDVQIW